jgi:hypothetical protein
VGDDPSRWRQFADQYADHDVVRAGRSALRAYEHVRERLRWELKSDEQYLPIALFGLQAVEGMATAPPLCRLYCLDRAGTWGAEVVAAIAWTVDGGGMSVISHLALVKDAEQQVDWRGYVGAMIALERLSDIGHAERRSTTVAIDNPDGIRHRDLQMLAFKHRGFGGEHVYERPDRAHPLRLVRIAYLRWTRRDG